MRYLISCLVLLALLATPALAAKSGDPLDGNDVNGSMDDACTYAAQYPACNWCWTQCLYAMLFEDCLSGGIGWDWDV